MFPRNTFEFGALPNLLEYLLEGASPLLPSHGQSIEFHPIDKGFDDAPMRESVGSENFGTMLYDIQDNVVSTESPTQMSQRLQQLKADLF